MRDPTGLDDLPESSASGRRVMRDGAATPPNTPLPGFTEDSCEEAATWGAAPDDTPPPMPWADVLAAAVVDVDADGTAQCAVQFVNEWLAGEDRAELRTVVGRQQLAGFESDPASIARLAHRVRVARGMRTAEEGTADNRFAPRQESTEAHLAPPAAPRPNPASPLASTRVWSRAIRGRGSGRGRSG